MLFSGKWPVGVQAEFQSLVMGHTNSEGNGGEVICRLPAFSSCHLYFTGNEDESFKDHLLFASSMPCGCIHSVHIMSRSNLVFFCPLFLC